MTEVEIFLAKVMYPSVCMYDLFTKTRDYANIQNGWWILKETVFVTNVQEVWLKGESINDRVFQHYGNDPL